MPLIVLFAFIALVNPGLQPLHLWERHATIATWRITKLDLGQHQMQLTLVATYKGTPEHAVTVALTDAAAANAAAAWQNGQLLVGLVGESSTRGDPRRVLFYSGTRSAWQLAQVSGPGAWTWAGPLPDTSQTTTGLGPLWGTWNGHVSQLARMMGDFQAGTAYFPTTAQAVLAQPVELARFAAGEVRGIAVRDLDGDGTLDILCAASSGVLALRGGPGLTWSDATASWGLAGRSARSVAAADVDGDGHDDLLLDGAVLLWRVGRFVPSNRLPTPPAELVFQAQFLDVDGDGLPDVLWSLRGGGLRLWRNPGDEAAFTEVTATWGLDLTAGQTGYAAAGDWNGDGAVDLFYAAGRGQLLVSTAAADGARRFVATPLGMSLSFKADGEDGTGRTGAAMFAPLWRPDGMDVLVATESRFAALTQVEGRIEEATAHGNEFADGAFRLLAGLAEDFDVDGTVDVIGLSSSVQQPSFLLMNRNYGSWMRTEKYAGDLLPPGVGDIGALGGVATDLDGDGAVDLVLAGADGVVRLVRNASLFERELEASPEQRAQEATVASARCFRIAIAGRGSLGAEVRILDAAGHTVAMRWAGAEALSGCRGPDAWSLSVREPGAHRVRVRFADGEIREQAVVWPQSTRTTTVTIHR